MNDIKSNITLSSIVAIAKNNVIGKNNTLIWHIPEDLKHFKRTTLGKPIIMGRKSFESIGKPLPGRTNIIISRSYKPSENNEDTILQHAPSIESAIDLAKSIAERDGQNEVFITGGGQIYTETLPYIERLYITILDRDYEGDTFFPEINWDEWTIKEKREHPAEIEKNRPSCTFYTLERNNND